MRKQVRLRADRESYLVRRRCLRAWNAETHQLKCNRVRLVKSLKSLHNAFYVRTHGASYREHELAERSFEFWKRVTRHKRALRAGEVDVPVYKEGFDWWDGYARLYLPMETHNRAFMKRVVRKWRR